MREWLPDNALFPTSLASEIDQAIDDWCMAWIGTTSVSREAFGRTTEAATPPASPSSPVDISLAKAGLDVVIADLLGVEPSTPAQSHVEQQIMEDFRAALISDFESRIRSVFSPGSEPHSQTPDARFRVGLRHSSGIRFGEIDLRRDVLVRSRKRRMPGARRPSLPPRALSDAVANLEIQLIATPGRAVLPVADLRKLAVGDVLVLDHPLAAPVHLSVQGCEPPVFGGLMIESEGARQLRIENRMLS